MLPQDNQHFAPVRGLEWITPAQEWFHLVAASLDLTVAEKVHLARVALQQQWICDVQDTVAARKELHRLGVTIISVNEGYVTVSGNVALAEYVDFRKRKLGPVEAGILYGYPPSATLAFAGIVSPSSSHPQPKTSAEYFLGGEFSRVHSKLEHQQLEAEWVDLKRHAPEICLLAESTFREFRALGEY